MVLITNIYIIIFFIIFISSYCKLKNYDKSLFISLMLLLILTIYNYNNEYIIILISFCVLFYVLCNNDVKIYNFIMIYYILFSCLEYFYHKYIMHGYNNSILKKVFKNIDVLNNFFDRLNKSHIKHHLGVDNKMNITDENNDESLFMNWEIFIYLTIYLFFIGLISKYISNYDISILSILILSFIVSFIWEYIWNKIHKKMHNLEYNYSIKYGPYDQGYFNLNYIANILYENHKKHHTKKKKGNYNIILLGADEWFNTHKK